MRALKWSQCGLKFGIENSHLAIILWGESLVGYRCMGTEPRENVVALANGNCSYEKGVSLWMEGSFTPESKVCIFIFLKP